MHDRKTCMTGNAFALNIMLRVCSNEFAFVVVRHPHPCLFYHRFGLLCSHWFAKSNVAFLDTFVNLGRIFAIGRRLVHTTTCGFAFSQSRMNGRNLYASEFGSYKNQETDHGPAETRTPGKSRWKFLRMKDDGFLEPNAVRDFVNDATDE